MLTVRSAGETVKEIPVRMRQTRMRARQRESPFGLLCQADTTSDGRAVAGARAIAKVVWQSS